MANGDGVVTLATETSRHNEKPVEMADPSIGNNLAMTMARTAAKTRINIVGVLDTGVPRSTCSWASSTAQLRPRDETTTKAGGEDPYEEAPHEGNDDRNL
jgi:hypothetical protein